MWVLGMHNHEGGSRFSNRWNRDKLGIRRFEPGF